MNATDYALVALNILTALTVAGLIAFVAYIAWWQLAPRENDPIHDVTEWTADNSINRRPGRR